jgi:hypothetical protein
MLRNASVNGLLLVIQEDFIISSNRGCRASARGTCGAHRGASTCLRGGGSALQVAQLLLTHALVAGGKASRRLSPADT